MDNHNMHMDSGDGGTGTASAVVGGQTYAVGSVEIITDFDPSKDVFDLGTDSIHNQIGVDRKSTRLNSSHPSRSRMPSSA